MPAYDADKLKALEVKFRGLAIEDGVRVAAEALAVQTGQVPARPTRLAKHPTQFPFSRALRAHFARTEARYGTLLDGAPDAMVVIAGNGEIVLVNAMLAALFGYERDALLGQPISLLVGGGPIDQLATQGVAAIDTMSERARLGTELAGTRQDGSSFPLDATLSLVDGDDGPVIVIALRNASPRKAAERHLANAETRSRGLFDRAPAAMLVVNKRGRIIQLNAAAEKLFGYGHDELAGEPVATILPEELANRLLDAHEPDAAGDTPDQPTQHQGRRKDGTDFPLEAGISILHDEQGAAVIATIRDLSRQDTADAAVEPALYRTVFDAAPDAVIAVDAAGDIVLANEEAEHRFGFEHGELVGVPAMRLFPEGFAERLSGDALLSAEVALAREIGTGIELTAQRKDGSSFPAEIMPALLETPGGTMLIATLRDLTVRRAAGRPALAETVHPVTTWGEVHPAPRPPADVDRATATLQSLGDALVSTDPAGRVGFMNEAAETLTGWSWLEASGRRLTEVVRVLDATTRIGFRDLKLAAAEPHERATQLHSNFVLVRRDGSEVPIEGSIAPIEGPDGVSGEVLVFRDVTQARSMAQKMAHSAHHDALTDLPNRVLLNDRIATAISIAPRHSKKVAVLFLDLDGFKRINDSLGHALGDKLLQAVAGRLMACVRGSDTVSRLGGDEFVVLLSEVERAEDSAITARRMLDAVAEPYFIDQHELQLTVSIGVSVYPDDGATPEALIKSADAAMYQAKENGRRGYQFYKPAMNLKAVERQSVEENLRHALEREEFSLHFQPKVNLHTGEIAGAEALLRWEHPTKGPMSPAVFVPVAEQSGLIQPIGHWVMREACRQTQAWLDAGLMLPSIAVNVSLAEFSGTRFLEGVFEALNKSGLDPTTLELEVTESVLMKDAEGANTILQALRASGVHTSVDDFGTGYSNLAYLSKFPIQTLKIDQSFVREISVGEGPTVITAVLNMAQSLNLRVVAEGVETPEELAFLQHHRCDEAQGYYFSKPLPAPQFARLLRDGLVATMAARQYARPMERLRNRA